MAVLTHSASARNAISTTINTEIGTSGNLVFRTAGAVAVATLPLSAVAGVVSGEVLTFNAVTSDTNAAGGVVTNFTIETSVAASVLAGDVAVSGASINLSSLTVGAGDTVSISALTYTSAP